MAQGIISAKYLYDIANAIRVKLDSQTLYTPAQMANAIASITGSVSGTITPSTDTGVGIITDSILDDIAEAVREKLDVQTLYTPSQLADAILSISAGSSVTAVPWATATDAEIAEIVAALDNGTMTIAQTGWSVGDQRTVSLSAMPATNVQESHAAQTAVFVIMDSQHFDLVGGGKDHFVVGMKNCLNETGKMNFSDTNSGSWNGCSRRAWCNNEFRNAIPETLRNCFKQFQCVTAKSYNGNELETSNDYFSLFASKEVFDTQGTSNATEFAELSEIAYYKNLSDKKKTANGSYTYWWLRSPSSNPSSGFMAVSKFSNSGQTSGVASNTYGLSPFGCI